LAATGFFGVMELHLDHCQIHSQELKVLSQEAVAHNPTIKTLVLSFNLLTAGAEDGRSAGGAVWYKQDTTGLEALADAMGTAECALSRLDVEVCDITRGDTDMKGALVLARGVCSCSTLQSMSFHYLRHDTTAWREGAAVIGTGGGHGVHLLTEEAISMAALCSLNGKLCSLDIHEACLIPSQVAIVVGLIAGTYGEHAQNNKQTKNNAEGGGEFKTLGALDALTSLNLQGNRIVSADWNDDTECMELDTRGLVAVCALITSPRCRIRSLNLADSAICSRSELCGVAACGADSEPAAMLVDALKTWTRSGIFAKAKPGKSPKTSSRRTIANPKTTSRRGLPLIGSPSPSPKASRSTIVARPTSKLAGAVDVKEATKGDPKEEGENKNFLDLSRNELPPKITKAIQRMCKQADIELRISAKTLKQQRLYGEGYFGS
jgi:hypothetical protein